MAPNADADGTQGPPCLLCPSYVWWVDLLISGLRDSGRPQVAPCLRQLPPKHALALPCLAHAAGWAIAPRWRGVRQNRHKTKPRSPRFFVSPENRTVEGNQKSCPQCGRGLRVLRMGGGSWMLRTTVPHSRNSQLRSSPQLCLPKHGAAAC
jgi:hypothetical protein